MSIQVNGALFQLAQRRGVEFPCLARAREETLEQLRVTQAQLADVAADRGAALCLMGSWGRHEVSRGSDHDWLILMQSDGGPPSSRFLDGVAQRIGTDGRQPGPQGTFGTWTAASKLVDQIGLDRDDNNNLTRRILLMLESLPVLHAPVYDEVRASVLDGYLDRSIKDYRPPRFFLNDIVRYWRTICVDFVGKERQHHGEGWGLRNAKLRNSRWWGCDVRMLPTALRSSRRDASAMRFRPGCWHFCSKPKTCEPSRGVTASSDRPASYGSSRLGPR